MRAEERPRRHARQPRGAAGARQPDGPQARLPPRFEQQQAGHQQERERAQGMRRAATEARSSVAPTRTTGPGQPAAASVASSQPSASSPP